MEVLDSLLPTEASKKWKGILSWSTCSPLLCYDHKPFHVCSFFEKFAEVEHARAGFVATETFSLKQGPLKQFIHRYKRNRKEGRPTFRRTLRKYENDIMKWFILSFFPMFSLFSMTEPLRKLGLPVELKNTVVTLYQDHQVCAKGDVLTPEQARILVRPVYFLHCLIMHFSRNLSPHHPFGFICT